jgi:predicted ATP-grasp superfamily ATP-dependent carboligase
MVVSKPEFNNAMSQINVSFDKLVKRVQALEEKVKAMEEAGKKTTRTKNAA